MNISRRRVRGIVRKEFREYRHNGNIIYTMAILPLIFLIQPLIQALVVSDAASTALQHEHSLLYLLAIPLMVPAGVAAYAIVGERLQGTLEPVLATPVRRTELLLGKAFAAAAPSIVVAYTVYGLFVAIVELFARPAVASALIQGSELLAQLLFTPLLAVWSTWLGLGVSVRSSDPRNAAGVAILVSLPAVAVTSLIAFGAIPATPAVAFAFAVGLLVLNRLGWQVASGIFDRERLITGTK
jgi:ABC-2 type transport system permease protein